METKTAIVTGASSGIGLALARAFLERGYAVIGNARTLSRLKKASEALGSPDRFVPVEGDIGRPEVAERLFAVALERFGHVDVLVNNAGVFIAKPTADYERRRRRADDQHQPEGLRLSEPASRAAHGCARLRLHHQHHGEPGDPAASRGAGAPGRPHQRRDRPARLARSRSSLRPKASGSTRSRPASSTRRCTSRRRTSS